MSIFSILFKKDPDSVYMTCIKIYEKAKKKRPVKSDKEYLKLVLLKNPPYDYQSDKLINRLLDEFTAIEALANHIADPYNRKIKKELWESRQKKLKFAPKIKKRNENFFQKFWG